MLRQRKNRKEDEQDSFIEEQVAMKEPDLDEDIDPSCCGRLSRWMQNKSYDWMAPTIWDNIVSGFEAGRVKAMQLMDIRPEDKVLFVGEGSGLDFNCLPEGADRNNLYAFDFSSEMVKQAKSKAKIHGIPEENCFIGDAQSLIFTDERFDKIYFPLSLASIPNPTLALQEAERVLAAKGKIVIFNKMVDEDTPISSSRQVINWLKSSVFADINRKLPLMLGHDSPLKITHYESLSNQLDGIFANAVSGYYRLAILVRSLDYPEQPTVRATL